ncbi:SDR family NAD(P)-dependent oxidoreductase [Pseudonocardia sp. MH-G8]|uniref:SDR family NAD(P)-dependent oxidoreductase n=1 Tax=Pseudonocardia sp. MH-G8 TaxID=1854588 RepID=UPI000BA0CBFD|nr:SDR family NAD(P)-dependent oxidoreductase [Pseudonocardia sp. MH-G8]OZM81331.1 short-chain dehydrogenase/reductase [Pseudonocardia sp. MH-G8]
MSQVFLVTGSSRGLGRRIVDAALAAGHRVVATARRPEQLADLADRYGERVRTAALDVTDPVAAVAAVGVAVQAFGRLDVVVNNARHADLVAIEDVDLEGFRAQVETTFFGLVTVTKAALPVLREQGRGHIVQVSSVGGRLASAGFGAYQASTWAVGGFAGVLDQEVRRLGIRVTVLEAGAMPVDRAESAMTTPPISAPYAATVGGRARMVAAGARGRASDPAKVAQVVLAVAAMDDPPLRLLLGSDAVRVAGMAARDLADADERWHELSVSTDQDESTAADLDPLGAASR